MADDNKALIASSEFDPTNFIKGIDAMTASLQKLSSQEDKIRGDMSNVNTALATNQAQLKATTDQITALDKTSKSYADNLAKLTAQQSQLQQQNTALQASYKSNQDALNAVNTSANNYKNALQQVSTTARQVQADNKGRTLFDVSSLNQQIVQITNAAGDFRNIFAGKIPTEELDNLEHTLAGTSDEFQQLTTVIDFVKSKLGELDPNTEQFKELTDVVATGEQVLAQYGNTVDNVTAKHTTLRTQLRAAREELARMEQQGQDNTKEFETLSIATGKLQEQFNRTQTRIRVLASETKNVDFGIGAIRGVASAFGVAEGAATLFGIKNEDVTQSIARLNSILLILNGLQELQNVLRKDSVVAIVGEELATKAVAAAQYIYTLAVGTSTGALKAFKIALLSTGIGALIVLLGSAIEAMSSFGDKTDDTKDYVDKLTAALEDQIDILGVYNDLVKNSGAVNEEQLKRTITFTANQNAQLKQQQQLEQELSDNRVKTLLKERQNDQNVATSIRQQQDRVLSAGKDSGDFIEKSNQQATQLERRVFAIDNEIRIEKEKNLTRTYDDNLKALQRQYELYQQYAERLRTLQRQLQDEQNSAQIQNAGQIRKQLADELARQQADINRDVNKGTLTKTQGGVLNSLLGDISKEKTDAALKEFTKNQTESRQRLNDQIYALDLEAGQQRSDLVADQLSKEAAGIKASFTKELHDLENARRDLLAENEQAFKGGFISETKAEVNAGNIKRIYDQLIQNLLEKNTQAQGELAAKAFDALQSQVTGIFKGAGVIISEVNTQEIQKLTANYLKGEISYADYQKQLTKIAQKETQERINLGLNEANEKLANDQKELLTETDPARKKQLQDDIINLRAQISDLKRQAAKADADGENADHSELTKKIEEIATYAQAIGGVINQVVSFWAQANQAEQQSLQKSIDLQQQRVDAATKIAEQGNAEYLRLEQDRLDQLTLKQENAARRQLAINAVLQASQALTAFVSALAQGIAIGGPLGGIAIAASVLALLASGYAIVKSLQPDTQQLAEGTTYVERGNNPKGRDTIPAMLNEGEAVIPGATNKKYHPTIRAIYDKSIPAEEMNNFVNSYRVNRRTMPTQDYDRMSEAATLVIGRDGALLEATQEQNRRLAEHAEIMKSVDSHLKGMGVSVNWDRNGILIDLMKGLDRHKIGKKS